MSEEPRFNRKPVTFESLGNSLAGSLVIPSGDGPHPAVVFVHGSGSTDRDGEGSYLPLFAEFARQGLASLSWDKPGVGESAGDHNRQTFEDRSAEVSAAIDMLRSRADIDPERIGLWGISQAGWVMPPVCAEDRGVAFMIAVSVPVSTVAEQNIYRIQHTFPADGLSDEQTEAAANFVHELQQVVIGGGPLEEVKMLVAQFENESWIQLAIGDPRDFSTFHRARPFLTFDVQPFLEQVRCPVLGIFGEKDRIVNVTESIDGYGRLLKAAGNSDLTVRVFPDANHGIMLAETGGQMEAAQMAEVGDRTLAPGYLDLMGSWVSEHIQQR